jgi:hypothetical protein
MEKLAQITSWAKEVLLSKGYSLSVLPEVVQATPWSSVTKFTTSNGIVYLKQTPPALSLEADVIQILRNEFNASVSVIIVANKNLNCYLMQDCGSQLRKSLKQNFQPDLLCQVIKKYTYIQDAVKNHTNTFIDLGVPDWNLDKLPLLYSQLLDREDLLTADGMTTVELKQCRALYPKLVSMCDQLSKHEIPPTLDHCDFHDGNVLITDTKNNLTIIDWGETVITQPFFSLLTFLNTVTYRYALKETDKVYLDLQNVCFENWSKILSKNDLTAAISLAKKLWPVYAALCFYRLILSSDLAEFKIVGRLSWHLKAFNEENHNA